MASICLAAMSRQCPSEILQIKDNKYNENKNGVIKNHQNQEDLDDDEKY